MKQAFKLRPCRQCGENRLIGWLHDLDCFQVICDECGNRTEWIRQEDAAREWNERKQRRAGEKR